MRERERLDDFRGGAVACRGCKRLLYFDVLTWAPQRCCTFAYVPTERQIDLVIYDKLAPGEFQEIVPVDPPGPLVISPSLYDETMGDPDENARMVLDSTTDPYLEEEEEIVEADIDVLAVTEEQVEERKAERLAQLKRRGQ